MPQVTINNLKVNYQILAGSKGKDFVIVPGWGGSSDSWLPVAKKIQELDYTVWVIDWPGFSKTQEMDRPWMVDDYVNLLERFLIELKVDNPLILAHSHGGRVLFKYLAKHNPDGRFFMYGAAGIPQELNFKQKAIGFLARIGKPLMDLPLIGGLLGIVRNLLGRAVGAHDYLKLKSPVMKRTMTNVLKEDVTELLPKIKSQIVLIWGSDDTYTPLAMGEKMNELLPNSKLIVESGARHGLHLKNPDRFFEILKDNLNAPS